MNAFASIAYFPAGHARRPVQCLADRSPSQPWAEDARFERLLRASRGFGGLAREHEILLRLTGRRIDAVGQVKDWVRRREGIHFRWSAVDWWPMFQFDSAMSLRWPVVRIAAEMRPVFDEWSLAEWFVDPNRWTGDRPPLDLIERGWIGVLEAARADRFLVAG
jgi:hypothetical protein